MDIFNSMPISLYRVSKIAISKLTYDQIALDGRWHTQGTPCIYAATSIAQALIESSIHCNLQLLHTQTTVLRYRLPPVEIMEVPSSELPSSYSDLSYSRECQEFGTRLLREHRAIAFSLPSVLLPKGRIIIFKPLHPDIKFERPEIVTIIPPVNAQVYR